MLMRVNDITRRDCESGKGRRRTPLVETEKEGGVERSSGSIRFHRYVTLVADREVLTGEKSASRQPTLQQEEWVKRLAGGIRIFGGGSEGCRGIKILRNSKNGLK